VTVPGFFSEFTRHRHWPWLGANLTQGMPCIKLPISSVEFVDPVVYAFPRRFDRSSPGIGRDRLFVCWLLW